MKTFKLLLAAVAAITLVSCGGDGKYEVKGDVVCHTYWTFSFGYRHDTLPGADPETFESVRDWLGHDSRHVYFKARLVPGVDIASLEACRYPLFRDKRDFYYMGAPLHAADVASFKILKWSEDDLWAIDSRCAYYDSIKVSGVDVATFKVKAHNCAVDRKHVYRYGKILPLADPDTYDEDWKGLYSRDKAHIWYCGDLLEDVDYASFDVDKEGVGFDKHGRFHGNKREGTEVEPEPVPIPDPEPVPESELVP